jgi:GrpB-like predicted nucleotidyltransferase (UPF0157 family)
MSEHVIIAPYNPRWPEFYEQEKELILSVLVDKVEAIEHAGSTAVPGLGAKPIIDMIAGVGDLDIAGECIGALAGIGYEYLPETNPPIPERRYFRKREPRLFHLHMCVYRGSFWNGLVLFRDSLRANPEVAEEYYHLKVQLAREYGQDRLSYTEAKAKFIERVISKTRKDG